MEIHDPIEDQARGRSTSSAPARQPVWRVIKFLLSIIVLAVFLLVVAVVFSATVVLVPAADPVKLLAGLAAGLLVGWLLLRGWQGMFKWPTLPSLITRAVGMAVVIAIPAYFVAIPISVPALADLPLKPQMIKVDGTGNQIAVYTYKAAHRTSETPIVFEVGGPGGSMRTDILNYLKLFADQGIDAYAYDSLGAGRSPDAKNPGADYNMDGEVSRLNEVVKFTGAEKVVLIAQSYGGNVATRYIAKHPASVAKYVAIDTAPIYSMSGNTPAESEKNKLDGQSSGNSGFPAVKDLDARGNLRMQAGFALTSILGRFPYGTANEYNYWISSALSGFEDLVAPAGSDPLLPDSDASAPATTYLSMLPSLKINADLVKTPDFTPELKAASANIPVLVVHPEFGIVPWETHNAYRDFFADVSYLPAPGAPHHVWGTERGRALLIKDATKFILGEDISADTWKQSTSPFGK